MRITVAAAALVGLCSAPALSADLDYGPLRGSQYEPASMVTPIVDWSGGYFGGFAGITQSNFGFGSTFRDPVAHIVRHTTVEKEMKVSGLLRPTADDARARAFGAFGGFNMQFQEVVVGIEADYTRGRMRGQSGDAIGRSFNASDGYTYDVALAGQASTQLEDYGTLRVRAGYTAGAFLPFVTGGVALGRALVARSGVVDLVGTDIAGKYPTVSLYQGFSAGPREKYSIGTAVSAGVDVQIFNNVFLRGEYQFVSFGDFDGHKANVNTIRGAAGVKF